MMQHMLDTSHMPMSTHPKPGAFYMVQVKPARDSCPLIALDYNTSPHLQQDHGWALLQLQQLANESLKGQRERVAVEGLFL
jgi:hypothetical protein